MSRSFDPLRLDVERFARQGAALEGVWPLAALPRLADALVAEASAREVSWAARGEIQPVPGQADAVWLRLEASAEVALVCQRCLHPLPHRLGIDRHLRFVVGEEAAARLDAELEDDVLAMSRALDLRELIEDELLLALPIVPRHETCPSEAVVAARVADEPEAERPNPFAALAALRAGKPRA